MTLIVGISGKARHGKNYLASALNKILDDSYLYSFANALKCYCRVSGLMTVKDGEILQLVGTDVYRSRKPNFWVNMLKYQIMEEKPRVAIITDVRFPNEVAWIEDLYGIVIRVERMTEDGEMWYSQDRPMDHPSEIALDNHEFRYKLQAVSGHLKVFPEYAEYIKNEVLSLYDVDRVI